MFLIAHRGLINGPDQHIENNPRTIMDAMNAGYDAEVDLQIGNDGRLYLGHDEPSYPISLDFLIQRGLWIHAKTRDALVFLANNIPNVNYFYHEEDPMVITTHGWVWNHPKHLSGIKKGRTVAVLPEYTMSIEQTKLIDCNGICSDYVSQLK